MSSRRKNPHPKRAENAKTVLKGEKEERPVLLCLRIPYDDEEDDEEDVAFDEVVEQQNEKLRKEKTATKRGKRKRGQNECNVCEKVFEYPSDLAMHMRIHTNEKPYECDVCEKRFSRAANLKVHMRIHTNEKPYECDVCEKRFRHSNTLKRHVFCCH